MRQHICNLCGAVYMFCRGAWAGFINIYLHQACKCLYIHEVMLMPGNTRPKEEMIEEWNWLTAKPEHRAVSRKRAHKEGIAHEGVHLWVISTINGRPEILFQHRAGHKESYPDCLDITVGGHVPFGKNEGKIQKEADEEIGISPADSELIDLGYFRYEEITDEMFHREFQRVYLYKSDIPLDKYRFNDAEVDAIFAIPLDDLEKLLKNDHDFISKGYDGKGFVCKELSRKDFHPLLFAPSMKEYMGVLLKAVKQFVDKKHVSVRMPLPG